MESGFNRSESRLKVGYSTVKRGAKARDLEFDLDFETYCIILEDGCHYCDRDPLGSKGGGGLDRVDNDEGYYYENVLPCCGDCNVVRQDVLTVEEMEVAMQAVLEFRQSSRRGN